MKKQYGLYAIALLIVFINSCKSSVEITQRRYRKGFYVHSISQKTFSTSAEQENKCGQTVNKRQPDKKEEQKELSGTIEKEKTSEESLNNISETEAFEPILWADNSGNLSKLQITTPVGIVTPTDEYYTAYTEPQYDPLAVISFISGILTWVFALLGLGIPYMGIGALLLSILAIVFGAVAIKHIDQDASLMGEAMARAGLILGIVYLAILLLLILLIILILSVILL
ncbi:MAG: DUF4190 domain-containing protein [Bacteroidetes bacterium]|nr:MAG: DUF4190 domain-containing protein [Bacteroidota bacterium]